MGSRNGTIAGLRADVARLEQKIQELQQEVLSQVTRLHGAMDESDRLNRELLAAQVKASKWDALQAVVDALSRHDAGS